MFLLVRWGQERRNILFSVVIGAGKRDGKNFSRVFGRKKQNDAEYYYPVTLFKGWFSMAGSIPEEVINKIRSHFDIVDFVGQYVPLRKSGRNHFGLCPFHSEKSPSFSVSSEMQFFHCFGCGESGDVFTFFMKIEGVEFVEAVKTLAGRAGITIPDDRHEEDSREHGEKVLMYEANELVAKLYHHVLLNLKPGIVGKQYLEKRGIVPETVTEFQIGYAPDQWEFVTNFLHHRGFPLPLMNDAGIIALREVGKRYYDRFRGRLMFPIHDGQGKVVGFGGRAIAEASPKYLNSPETILFNKGKLLFNLHRARKEIRRLQQAVLFEGYMDVISAWQAGIHNGVATLGTALSKEQARVLQRIAGQVILCYDSDAAGVEAAVKGAEILVQAGCTVKVAKMPDGMDPDDYIKRFGGEKFLQNVLMQAQTLTSFRLEYLKSGKRLNDEADRIKYLHEALHEIARLQSAVERDHYLRQLADEFQLSYEALKQEQWKIYRKQKGNAAEDNWTSKWNNSKNNGSQFATRRLLPAFHLAERFLIAWMMRDRDIAARVQTELENRFHVDGYAALTDHLYAFYREGNQPDPGRFIQQLPDQRLAQLASELAMQDISEEISEKELADCIRQVLNHGKKLEIDRLKQEQQRLVRMGDSTEAAQIGIEILQLEKQLKGRKK